jgi:aspartyl-tRNA(Asn)/glutamyl-tRNA(Gln) amidotransferase subunit C
VDRHSEIFFDLMRHVISLYRISGMDETATLTRNSLPLFAERCIILKMSTITTDDVRHLAQLSNLQLSDEEIEHLGGDLSNILNYIDQLSELDTTGVEPTYQVTGLENIWRDDEIETGYVDRDALLALAPERTEDSVKVPKVL